MIYKILSSYAEKLEDFLGSVIHQPGGIVKVGDIVAEEKEEIMNKLVIALLSMERDTSQGVVPVNVRNNSGGFNHGQPPLNMNLNVVLAAVYDPRRYGDALSVLSSAILFLQVNPFFAGPGGQKYTTEIVTLASEELSNIWTYMGGHYYPSVVIKIRKVVFDAGEIRGISKQAGKPSVETGNKK